MTNWINAKKQQPEEDGRYLVVCGEVFIATYVKSMKQWKHREGLAANNSAPSQEVWYWMPLPEPPKK